MPTFLSTPVSQLYWIDAPLATGQTCTATSVWLHPTISTGSTSSPAWMAYQSPPRFAAWGQQDPSWEQQVRQEIMRNQTELRRISNHERMRMAQPHVRPSQIQAEAKARDLLLASLTSDQRASLQAVRWFVVEGKSGRRYRVHDGHAMGNVDVLEEGEVLYRLCGHLGDTSMPLADHLLAQKLMLEADEDAFLQLANRHA